ncbi:MAG: ADP-ribosylglycohydrolase family protein [Bacteroidales bacterium]|nr:ADP-ribosylglycohydrolase family protein [Bacteroidales bacterium]
MKSQNLPIIGAVCGDILGSCYEWAGIKYLDHPLCLRDDQFTDDTVCTIAITDAIINQIPFADSLRNWCRKYPHAGYGGTFRRWFRVDDAQPYNSWGNGSAMRVSAAGAIAKTLDEALKLAKSSAEVTHNHPEGIKGAQATAAAIFLAKSGLSKNEIKTYVERTFGYDLNRKYTDIQMYYSFDVSCQGSVPESIICFLESKDYEDSIRHAIALGGDADTMAAICGSIAAAFYGEIPETILSHCMSRLPNDMKEIIDLCK